MRLLIAEHTELFLEGLKAVLGRLDGQVTVAACTAFADALEAAKNTEFDLVLLDRGLPGMDGIAGVEVFRAYFPAPRLVILAEDVRRAEVQEALRHGAAGFLPRGVGAEAFLNAVRLVLSGERYVPAGLLSAERLSESAPATAGTAADTEAFEALTERESDVLERLLEGLTNKEIGRALDVQEITVKLHLRGVYRKLGVKNRAQAVAHTLAAGWRR
jgi:DNA-binding NarL/FixJ family response regulator